MKKECSSPVPLTRLSQPFFGLVLSRSSSSWLFAGASQVEVTWLGRSHTSNWCLSSSVSTRIQFTIKNSGKNVKPLSSAIPRASEWTASTSRWSQSIGSGQIHFTTMLNVCILNAKTTRPLVCLDRCTSWDGQQLLCSCPESLTLSDGKAFSWYRCWYSCLASWCWCCLTHSTCQWLLYLWWGAVRLGGSLLD